MTHRASSTTKTSRAQGVGIVAEWCFLLLAVLVIAASQAMAQTAQPAQTPVESQEQAGTGGDKAPETGEMVDVVDLIRKLRHKDQPPSGETQVDYSKRMRAIAPVIGAKPSSGIIFGVAGNIGFFRGEPSTTRISSSVASATFTTKKQAGISAHTTMFGRDDRWLLELDHRFQWTSQETFGLGTSTASAAGEVIRFDFYRLYQSAYLRLRQNLYAGAGLHFDSHADVHPDEGAENEWPQSAYYEYSVDNGLPLDTQISAGPSVEIIWDSRDSFINPSRGWLARAGYRALIDGFLGGDSSWEKVSVDVRAYAPLSSNRRYKLAVWAYADLVVDGVAPYFDLPSTAGDSYGRSGRGYAEGHFRGEKLAFVELEYRAPLMRNDLLGMVAFVNTTTISNRQGGEQLFDNFAPGAGAGLRLLLNKRSRTNLAFDVGFGENGNRGVYLVVQEAF
jgi:outer membrane protein assembly factor BamA